MNIPIEKKKFFFDKRKEVVNILVSHATACWILWWWCVDGQPGILCPCTRCYVIVRPCECDRSLSDPTKCLPTRATAKFPVALISRGVRSHTSIAPSTEQGWARSALQVWEQPVSSWPCSSYSIWLWTPAALTRRLRLPPRGILKVAAALLQHFRRLHLMILVSAFVLTYEYHFIRKGTKVYQVFREPSYYLFLKKNSPPLMLFDRLRKILTVVVICTSLNKSCILFHSSMSCSSRAL